MLSPEIVETLMREVMDPELGSNIVELGMYKEAIIEGGVVTVKVALTTKGCPLRAQIQNDIKDRLLILPEVEDVKLIFSEMSQDEKSSVMNKARENISKQETETEIQSNTRVLLIASGKGGVGKSTITVNLAVALAMQGYTVGLLDADIWGFSVTQMLGLDGRLEGSLESKKILPHEIPIEAIKEKKGMLKVISMGLLVESTDTALMWRGLILNRAVQHFLQDVDWGDLDYLLVDMPPGTGDIQMGIAKLLPRSEMIIVTIPAKNSSKISGRAIAMGRKNYLRIVGVIENFSSFIAPDGTSYELFGSGGGEALSQEMGVSLLGKIPIDTSIANGGDEGVPVAFDLDNPVGKTFHDLAKNIYTVAAPPLDMSGCSATSIKINLSTKSKNKKKVAKN